MRDNGLLARIPKRFRVTTDSDHALPIAPNLLEQNFTTDRPNRVWVADITYVWTAQGWGYLAAVLDLFARRVVGWSFADHMRTELPLKALDWRTPAEAFNSLLRSCEKQSVATTR